MKKILIVAVVLSVAFVGLYSTVNNANAFATYVYRDGNGLMRDADTIVRDITLFTISNTNSYCIFSQSYPGPSIKYSTTIRFQSVDGAYNYYVYRNNVKVGTVNAKSIANHKTPTYRDIFGVSNTDQTYKYRMIAVDGNGRLIGTSNTSTISVPGNCAYAM